MGAVETHGRERILIARTRAGLSTGVTEEFFGAFARGTSPADWSSTPDIDGVKSLLSEQP